jgi:hypothetical protein
MGLYKCLFLTPKSHKCYSCKCYKMSMLTLVSVINFLAPVLLKYIEGGLKDFSLGWHCMVLEVVPCVA